MTKKDLIEINREHTQWWKELVDNALKKDGVSSLEHFSHLVAMQEAIENSWNGKTIVTPVTPKPRRKRATKNKKLVSREVDPFKCDTHPNRTGVQAPRDDCDSCWDIYKKLHPMEYSRKRKEFERKAKKKEQNNGE